MSNIGFAIMAAVSLYFPGLGVVLGLFTLGTAKNEKMVNQGVILLLLNVVSFVFWAAVLYSRSD